MTTVGRLHTHIARVLLIKPSNRHIIRRSCVRNLKTQSYAGMKPFGDTFFLDDFADRQFDDPSYSGTRIIFEKEAFVAKVHSSFHDKGSKLADG